MDATDYTQAVTPAVIETRDLVLRLELMLKTGGPGAEALYIAAMLNGLRRTLAAVECNLETITAARELGRDEARERWFRRGYEAGLIKGAGRRADRKVIPIGTPRAITA